VLRRWVIRKLLDPEQFPDASAALVEKALQCTSGKILEDCPACFLCTVQWSMRTRKRE
jgi:hypothetical protein